MFTKNAITYCAHFTRTCTEPLKKENSYEFSPMNMSTHIAHTNTSASHHQQQQQKQKQQI